MSFVAPSESKIVQESIQFNQPVSESSTSAIAALANALREIILPVGSIVDSMLDESTFQSQNTSPSPERWVLADGRNVAGSVYQSLTGSATIPDLRGNFTRAKNNGRSDGKQNPDGDLALGTYTASKFASHMHAYTDPGHTHGVTDPGHAHTVSDPGHSHGVTDPGHIHAVTDPQHSHGYTDPTHTHGVSNTAHTHPILVGLFGTGGGSGNILSADDATNARTYNTQSNTVGLTINAASVGISINSASTGISVNSHSTGLTVNTNVTSLTVNSNVTSLTVNSAVSGITISNTGGNETAPENYTVNRFIRIN